MANTRQQYTPEFKLKVVLESLQRETCAGYIGYPLGKLIANLFSYMVL